MIGSSVRRREQPENEGFRLDPSRDDFQQTGSGLLDGDTLTKAPSMAMIICFAGLSGVRFSAMLRQISSLSPSSVARRRLRK